MLVDDRMLDSFHKFKQLNVIGALKLMPQGEMAILHAIMRISAKQNGRCSVSDLAKELRVTPPGVSRACRNLREKGYLDSVPDENDRRNTCLVITSSGRRAIEMDIGRINEFMCRVFTHLEPGELEEFYRLFDKLFESIRQELASEREKG